MFDKENSSTRPDAIMLLKTSPRRPFLATLALWGAALAGCAADGPVKGVAEIAGMATTPQESKTFVQETRPASVEYVPVGRETAGLPLCRYEGSPLLTLPSSAIGQTGSFPLVQPDPKGPCKPVADFKALETELEMKRLRNDAEGTQAKALGQALPPPKPPVLLPPL